MQCVTTPSIAVLWNGSKLENFSPCRGIRQGDPISPYLFVLCIERLSHLINEEVRKGKWKSIRLSRRGPDLSHLFFSDDMMLFAEATENQVQVILDCLSYFCQSSGQRVNFAKSSIHFSSSIDSNPACKLSLMSGIPITEHLDTYLGSPVVKGRQSKDHYKHVIERIQARLAGWKSKHLTLAQSILSTIPYYTMQTSLILVAVCDEIQRISGNFI